MKKTSIAILALGLIAGAQAQVAHSGGTYTQNFDTLLSAGTANAWTDNTTIAGWYMRRMDDVNGELADQYNAGTGSSNSGAVYSFGTGADRALGAVGSGSVEHSAFGLRLTNTSGSTINSFSISFTGEQWRDGGNLSAALQSQLFSYKVGGTTIGADTQVGGGAANYVADPTFTTFSALDFTSPVAAASSTGVALDGNLAANRTAISSTVTGITWAAGTDLWVRWVDINNVGNDHGLAIDDFSLTANPVPEPGTMAALGLGAAAMLRRRRNK